MRQFRMVLDFGDVIILANVARDDDEGLALLQELGFRYRPIDRAYRLLLDNLEAARPVCGALWDAGFVYGDVRNLGEARDALRRLGRTAGRFSAWGSADDQWESRPYATATPVITDGHLRVVDVELTAATS